MPRQLRLEYAGAVYHVINRGDRRESIFKDDVDRGRFLDTLAEVCTRTDWQVHAFCLMDNHFHLVIETPAPNLAAGMKWFLGTYTARFNRRHKLAGHLFGGRYKSLIVDAASPGYFRTVCDYVHLNPARANLLPPDRPLREFAWSSFQEYLKPPARRWPCLRVDRLLGELRIPADSAAGRRELERQTEACRSRGTRPDEWKSVRRGWYLGGDAFREELLERASSRTGANHHGAERRESDEVKAERIVLEELATLRWTEQDLARRRKGDPGKLIAARRLRRETTVTLRWIATRLRMGSWTHVANLLRKGVSPDYLHQKCQK